MWMQTAKRAQLPLYKLTQPGHNVTAGGVQVEVRYYTRADVQVWEFVFRHHFKVLEIPPELVSGVPWLQSYKATVDWKERYADVRHRSTSYRFSFDESRDSTQFQFRAASKLDLLTTPSSRTSKVSPAGSPAPLAKEHTDLRSSTRAKCDADALDESKTEDGITDEDCSNMETEYILFLKLKREIRVADLTGDQVFLCCMPQPAVQVNQMHNMQDKSDHDGLDPVRRNLPIQIHKLAAASTRKRPSNTPRH